jgi:hypothetical protein
MVGLGSVTILAMRTNLFQLLLKRFRFKANLASPTFTGTVSGIDKKRWLIIKCMITAKDANKPVSSATQNSIRFESVNWFRFKSAIKLTSFQVER